MILFFSHSLSYPNKKLTYVLFAGLVNIYICSCCKTWLNTQMRKVNAQILASKRISSSCISASTKISSKKLIQPLRLVAVELQFVFSDFNTYSKLKNSKDFHSKMPGEGYLQVLFLPYLTTQYNFSKQLVQTGGKIDVL